MTVREGIGPFLLREHRVFERIRRSVRLFIAATVVVAPVEEAPDSFAAVKRAEEVERWRGRPLIRV